MAVSNEIPCNRDKLSDTDFLVLDVTDDFELSVAVVNVVAYICAHILRTFWLQAKCLDCLRILTDTRLVVSESYNFLERVERVFQINNHKVMVLMGIL